MLEQHITTMEELGCKHVRVTQPSLDIPDYDETIHGETDHYYAHPDYDCWNLPLSIEEYIYHDGTKLICNSYYDPDSFDNTVLVRIYQGKTYEVSLRPFTHYGDFESLSLILKYGFQVYIELMSCGHKLKGLELDPEYPINTSKTYDSYYWARHYIVPLDIWRFPFIKACDSIKVAWKANDGVWRYVISASYQYEQRSHGRHINLKELMSVSYSPHNLGYVMNEIEFLKTLITKPFDYGIEVYKNNRYRLNPTLIIYVLDQMSYSYTIESLTINDFVSFKLVINILHDTITFDSYYYDYDRFDIYVKGKKASEIINLDTFYSFFEI